MEFAELESELQQWMLDAIHNGRSRSAVVDALLKAGYQPTIANAVEQCFRAHAPAEDAPSEQPPGAASSVTPSRKPDVRFPTFNTGVIPLGDQQVEARFAIRQPNIVLFANFLAEWECDALVEMSRPNLSPSRVVNTQHGAFELKPSRTSGGTHFARGETPLIADIEARIASLLKVPEAHGEPLQILHYPVSGEYRPHYDFFDPEKPGNQEVLAAGGQRVGTLIMYLSDVESGGATVFPRVGLEVQPQKGAALFFSYVGEHGKLDLQSLHGGSPVLAGEKWIATKWLRAAEYPAY
uniref:2OG-Fe(II) oxygenase n=1 Tax=Microbulbifer agarilyticus TaxID=260552 RepID=UPI000255BB9E|nr:2OG-Fe(II) oxygenase [Microbulbifer agarilyticus]